MGALYARAKFLSFLRRSSLLDELAELWFFKNSFLPKEIASNKSRSRIGSLITPATTAGPHVGPGQIVEPHADRGGLCLGIDRSAFKGDLVLFLVGVDAEHQFSAIGVVLFR